MKVYISEAQAREITAAKTEQAQKAYIARLEDAQRQHFSKGGSMRTYKRKLSGIKKIHIGSYCK